MLEGPWPLHRLQAVLDIYAACLCRDYAFLGFGRGSLIGALQGPRGFDFKDQVLKF